jgi:glycosyltransferase involved in cell wall biosynthesis
MSQASPLVSIIIPNFNYARTLPLCIEAARAQTYAPVEILCVDDRSTDGSAQVAAQAGVPVLRTPTNSGPAAARNLGASHPAATAAGSGMAAAS